MSDPDAGVVGRALGGDQGGFAELFVRYDARSFRTAVAITGDAFLAEDAQQEAFLTAFRTLSKKPRDLPFAAWLYRCVLRAARSQAKRRRRSRAEVLSDLPNPTSAFGQLEVSLDLVDAVQSLPTQWREVLVLRFFLDLSVQDAARVLRCRSGTVKSRTNRALKELAKRPGISALKYALPVTGD